jgi:hypothetical protein
MNWSNWEWFAAFFLCIVTGGMTSIRYQLDRTNRTLDNTNGILADIRSILERMEKDRPQSAPAPTEPPDAL